MTFQEALKIGLKYFIVGFLVMMAFWGHVNF